jgi:hypothetical protein
MKKKYFISCALPGKKLGGIQLECKPEEMQAKAEELCPHKAHFRSFIVNTFDENMPVGEFVPYEKMKELGY